MRIMKNGVPDEKLEASFIKEAMELNMIELKVSERTKIIFFSL